MPVITGATATATAAGIAATVSGNVVELDTAIAFASGVSALVPHPTATTVADQVHTTAYTSAGTFLAHLPRRNGVAWMAENNLPGTGSARLRLADLEADGLSPFNIVRHTLSGRAHEFIYEATGAEQDSDDGERFVTMSGRGTLAILENAVVFPEYTFQLGTADDRSFDYGSKEGSWYIASEWKTPVGIPQGSPASVRKGFPRGWPDRKCEWIWSRNPNAKSPNGKNHFRGSFTLAARRRIRIWAVGDDRMELQLNGEVILRHANNHWRKPKAVTLTLEAGTYLLAAEVENTTRGTDDKSGFLCLVAEVNEKDKIVRIIKRTRPSTWKVRGYKPTPPGWYPAQILKTLVEEAQARSVDGFAGITFGFTDTHDSDGRLWTDRVDIAFGVSTTSLLDVVAQLVENGLNVEMAPGLVLNAYISRGFDRTSAVTLAHVTAGSGDQGIPTPTGERRPAVRKVGQGVHSKIKNVGAVRHRHGWEIVEDSPSQAEHGIREGGLILGRAASQTQAATIAGKWYRDTGQPETTIQVTTTSAKGPQPFVDYNLFDLVLAPGLSGDYAPHRVLSITAREDDDTGLILWTHELYPEV